MIKKLWKLFVNRETITYGIAGVSTTIVNFIAYHLFCNVMGIPNLIANAIAWVIAVAFAYLTNKPFVFKSHDWSAKTVIPELTKFVGCRVASGAAETLILLVTVDLLHWNGNIWKIVTSVLVVVMNYIASKLVVFKKK